MNRRVSAKLTTGLILIASGLCQGGPAQQEPVVVRPKITEQTRLAIADFVARTSRNRQTETALGVFNEVLWSDLEFSGYFELPSKSFYPLRPLQNPSDLVLEDWRVSTLDVDFITFGNLQVDATVTRVDAFLYDVRTGERILGKRYTVGDSALIRRIAHEFADQVVFYLSGGESSGVARTRIAFSAQRGDGKEIYLMDYDGENRKTITANGGLNKFPEWSRDNSMLGYVAKLPSANEWRLWIQNLEGGHSIFQIDATFISSPSFSPDGRRVAFAARLRGRVDSDVYVANLDGSGLRNLTNHPAIDTAPTWSPNGAQLAFISDRSGTPQVWSLDADGSNLERVVSEGGHCDSPDWSPDGRFILYSWQAPSQWSHDIYIVEVATGQIRQLTSGSASNESPHWSPDGRHIVFQSDRSGSKQVFIMNIDGRNLKQLTAYGINESPSWSGYEPLNITN